MKLYPHINFGGQCEAAFRFYEQCLGGKVVTMLSWGDSPMSNEVPPEWRDKISHATLAIGENELAGVDNPFEPYERPKGFQIIFDVDRLDEAERIFNSLAENGTIRMPLQQTFWALRFGVLTDQFGVPWEINCTRSG